MSSNLKMNWKRFFTPHFFFLAANPKIKSDFLTILSILLYRPQLLIEGTSFIAVLLSYKKLSSFTVLVVFKKLTTLQFRSIVTS